MIVLALEHGTATSTAAAFTPDLLRAEARRVWEMQQAGVIREVYFRADRHDAVLVLECPADEGAAGAAAAETHLATLPLVQAGLIRFEIIPLLPYDGFARLFSAAEP